MAAIHDRAVKAALLGSIIYSLSACSHGAEEAPLYVPSPPPPYPPPPPYIPPPPPFLEPAGPEPARVIDKINTAKTTVRDLKNRIQAAKRGDIRFAEPAAETVTGPLVACPQLGRPATAAECENYAALYASLQKGIAAFDPPRAMHMGRQYPVKLVIGSEDVAAQVVDSATDAGSVKTVDVRLGAWICAELLAPQFDVAGEAKQCRERGAARIMGFDWTVSPKLDGRLKLGVKIESFAQKGGAPLDAMDSRMIAVDVKADAIGRFDMMVSRLTDSLGGVRSFLLALLSALGVISAIVWRVRKLGQKPDKDALNEMTAT